MPAARFDFTALHRALDEKRKSRGFSWQQAALEVGRGISPSTLKGTAKGGPMEADGVRAMVRWLGLTVEDFTRFASNWTPPTRAERAPGRRFDTRAFYELVNKKRLLRGISWKQAASELRGFSSPMPTRLAKRGRMSIEQVVELSAWLGEPSERFTYLTEH